VEENKFKIGDCAFYSGRKTKLVKIADITNFKLAIVQQTDGQYFETSIDRLTPASYEDIIAWKLMH
jgi:hypothetical protein